MSEVQETKANWKNQLEQLAQEFGIETPEEAVKDELSWINEGQNLLEGFQEAGTLPEKGTKWTLVNHPIILTESFISRELQEQLNGGRWKFEFAPYAGAGLMLGNARLLAIRTPYLIQMAKQMVGNYKLATKPLDDYPKHLIEDAGVYELKPSKVIKELSEDGSYFGFSSYKELQAAVIEKRSVAWNVPDEGWEYKVHPELCRFPHYSYNDLTEQEEMAVVNYFNGLAKFKNWTIITAFSTHHKGFRYALVMPNIKKEVIDQGSIVVAKKNQKGAATPEGSLGGDLQNAAKIEVNVWSHGHGNRIWDFQILA